MTARCLQMAHLRPPAMSAVRSLSEGKRTQHGHIQIDATGLGWMAYCLYLSQGVLVS
jgi:hypothetical protein